MGVSLLPHGWGKRENCNFFCRINISQKSWFIWLFRLFPYLLCKTKYQSTKMHSCTCTGVAVMPFWKLSPSSCPTLLYTLKGTVSTTKHFLSFKWHPNITNSTLPRPETFVPTLHCPGQERFLVYSSCYERIYISIHKSENPEKNNVFVKWIVVRMVVDFFEEILIFK